MKLTIIHTSGARAGTRQSISSKQIIKLGRHPDNDCVFNTQEDGKVSAFHAEIRIAGEQAIITDKNSTNGTFVNEEKVTERPIKKQDRVRLGDVGPEFTVEYAAPTLQNADPVPKPEPDQTTEKGEPGHKIYGQRTVGVMIQQALAAAETEKPKGTSKSTEYFEALVDNKVKKTSSNLKLIVTLSIIALVLIGAGFGIYMYRNRSVQVYQTTQVNYGESGGGPIAAANRYSVFMLAGVPKTAGRNSKQFQGFCTAFAVSANVLATNAHCVLAANNNFNSVTALMNGSPQHRYTVTKMVPHPGYVEGSISPDVALIKINGNLNNLIQMAGSTELSQMAPGVTIFLYGFPGRLNKEEAPEATFIKGDIGRVTAFDQKLGDFGRNTLLQHSAYCTGGTSGSPMFNSAGHVVGINAGGYVENGEALSGYNFGMRIDLINSLFPLLSR